MIIIGVTSNGVQAYSESTLGVDISAACDSLERLFTNESVDVLKLCEPAKTTTTNVLAELDGYFHREQGGQLTLLFIMAHGEVTKNNDVRLLLSDATDADKDEHSILLREKLASLIGNASDSVTVAFIDACYSGRAGDLRLGSLGFAAELEGTHVGILGSSLPDEKAYAVAFTNALIDIWKNEKANDCPHNSEELSSDLLSRLPIGGNTPTWLINFHDSLCFNDLLNPKKRVISIWRDPNHKDPFKIQLFDDKDKQNKPVLTVSQEKVFANPYVLAVVPGKYRIETHGRSSSSKNKDYELLDKETCDFVSPRYCSYSYPHSAITLVESLNIQRQIYHNAIAHGYSESDLATISDDTAQIYASLIRTNPKEAAIQDRALSQSESKFWTATQGSLAAHNKNAPKMNIKADQDAIDANLQDIEDNNKRFAALSNYDVRASTSLHFSISSATLSDEDKKVLSELAQTATSVPGYIVEITGYADVAGSASMNTELSEDRAKAVINYLTQKGNVPVRHIVAPGAMGEYGAAATKETKAGRAENRRVEVKVLANRGLIEH